MLIKTIINLSLLCFLTISNADALEHQSTCKNNDFLINANTLKSAAINPTLRDHFCYSDKKGEYVIYLSEKQSTIFQHLKLSSTIKISQFEQQSGQLKAIQSIDDFANQDEAGISFLTKLTEVLDIDRDGFIEPIMVYRFLNLAEEGPVVDSFQGRLKMIMFYKTKKVVIRANTSELDFGRSITANQEYFKLPKSVRNYLVKKIIQIDQSGEFSFDNTYNFSPQKEKQ